MTQVLDTWIQRGYVVVQTDYQGLGTPGGHPYINGLSEANTVTDIVQAARSLNGSIGTDWVAAGHSQSGQAALFAAQYAATRQPQLSLKGAVAIAPGGIGLSRMVEFVDSGRPGAEAAAAFLPLIVLGAHVVEPAIDPGKLFTPAARPMLDAASTGCVAQIREVPPIPATEIFEPDADFGTLTRYLEEQDPSVTVPEAAAVFMTISAVGITAATAHAEPAVTRQPSAVTAGDTTSGVDHGITYRITVSPVDGVVTATVENGRFERAHNGAVVLGTGVGTVAAEVPRWYAARGRSIAVAQHIGADGHTLTLTPAMTAADDARVKDISSYSRLAEQIDKNLPGVVGGAIVGGILGACLFLIWGISIPVGVLIGGTLGGYVMGGPDLLDPVQAFATGRP